MVLVLLAACNGDSTDNKSTSTTDAAAESQDVQPEVRTDVRVITVPDAKTMYVYTDLDLPDDFVPLKQFESIKGVKVNLLRGSTEDLIARIKREEQQPIADNLLVKDALSLYKAKSQNICKPLVSNIIRQNVPESLRDHENKWYGLTRRGWGIMYDKSKVDPAALKTYADLANEQWRGQLLVGAAADPGYQSLLASLLARQGQKKVTDWVAGVVANLARPAKGSEDDQIEALVAGQGQLALVSSRAVIKFLSNLSDDSGEGDRLGFTYLNSTSGYPHTNVSGVAILEKPANFGNALAFAEFITGAGPQLALAQFLGDVQVHPQSSGASQAGPFESDDLFLDLIGHHNSQAKKVMQKVGWK